MHFQQYRWPQGVTTGSFAESRQILHSNIASADTGFWPEGLDGKGLSAVLTMLGSATELLSRSRLLTASTGKVALATPPVTV